MLTMKLYFNDEVTPADYHPSGFMEAKSDDFIYEDETVNIKVREGREVNDYTNMGNCHVY